MIYVYIYFVVELLLWVAAGFAEVDFDDDDAGVMLGAAIVFWPLSLVAALVIFPCWGAVRLGSLLREWYLKGKR